MTQKDRQRVVVKKKKTRKESGQNSLARFDRSLPSPLLDIIPFERWIVEDRFITSRKGLSFHTVFCLLLSFLCPFLIFDSVIVTRFQALFRPSSCVRLFFLKLKEE